MIDTMNGTQEQKEQFAKNVRFIRSYIGFIESSQVMDRAEFANRLDISTPTLRSWELGQVMPTTLSLRSLLDLIHEVLRLPKDTVNEDMLFNLNMVSILPTFCKYPEDALAGIADHLLTNVQQKDKRFRNIVEHTLSGIATIEHNRITYANQKLSETLGYNIKQLIDLQDVEEIIHPDSLEVVRHLKKQAKLNPDSVYDSERVVVIHQDGHPVNLLVNMVTSKVGNSHTVFISAADITEIERQSHFETSIREQFERERDALHNILKAMPVGIILFNSGSIPSFVNHEFTRITGYELHEIRNLNDLSSKIVLDSDVSGKFYSKLTRMYETDLTEYLYVRSKHNNVRYVCAKSAQVGNGKALLSLHDLTKYETTHRDALAREAQFIKTLDALPSMALIMDMDYTITFVNRSCARVLGYNQDELLGHQAIDTLVAEKDRKQVLHNLQHLATSNTGGTPPQQEGSNQVITKDGTHIEVVWTNTLLGNGYGEPIGIAATGYLAKHALDPFFTINTHFRAKGN